MASLITFDIGLIFTWEFELCKDTSGPLYFVIMVSISYRKQLLKKMVAVKSAAALERLQP